MAKLLMKDGLYLTHNFELSTEESKAKAYTANEDNFAKIAVKHQCDSYLDLSSNIRIYESITPATNPIVLKYVVARVVDTIKATKDRTLINLVLRDNNGALFAYFVLNYIKNVYEETLDCLLVHSLFDEFEEYYLIGVDFNDEDENYDEHMYGHFGRIYTKEEILFVNGNADEDKWYNDLNLLKSNIGIITIEEYKALDDFLTNYGVYTKQ